MNRLYPWYVVGVLMTVSVLSFVDRQILNLLVGPIRKDLGLSDTQIGVLMGPAFAVCFCLFGLWLGRLADRHSRRALIAIGLVLWSAATAACGLAQTHEQLLLARMAVGIGEAALAPAAFSLIADYFAPARRATAMSVYSMGIYIGSGLAFTLGGAVVVFALQHGPVTLPGVGEIRPWQSVFLMLGAAGLLFSPMLMTVREPARGAQHAVVPLRTVFEFFGRHRRALSCHNLGFGFAAMAGYASAAWLPTFFVRVHGWPPGRFGLYYGVIVAVFCSAGIVCGGWLADRWRHSGQVDAAMRVGQWGLGLAAAFGVLYVLPADAAWGLALIAPAAFLAGLPTGVGPAALQELAPANLRGQVSAVSVLVINLVGLGLGPTAVALCTDYLFADPQAVGLSILIVCVCANLLGWILISAGRPFYRAALT